MMEVKKRRSLRQILATAFTFAMVMVFAGLVSKVDANAETGTSTFYVTVKDASNGNFIEPNEEKEGPHLELWKERSTQVNGSTVCEMVGTIEYTSYEGEGKYKFDFGWDTTYAKYIFPAATIEGYQEYGAVTDSYILSGYTSGVVTDETTGIKYVKTGKMSNSAGYGKGAVYIEESNGKSGTISLTPQPNSVKLQTAISSGINQISTYAARKDYDPDEQSIVDNIVKRYSDLIEDIDYNIDGTDNDTTNYVKEQQAIIAGYVEAAKAEIDQVATSQDNTNDNYIDDIYFVDANGNRTTKSFAGSNGNYTITMSMNEAGGRFYVKGCEDGSGVTWDVKDNPWSNNQSMALPREYIAQNVNKGVFLNPGSAPEDCPFVPQTLNNCSVTFTPAGSETPVTVTFTFVVKSKLETGLSVEGIPEKPVTLSRNDDLEYTTVLDYGTRKGYSVSLGYDSEEFETLGYKEVKVESLNTNIATVDDENTIKAVAAGEATFRVTYENENGQWETEFSITFAKSAKEEKEIADAAKVEELIAGLGTVTISKESAIQAARDAYNKLSDNAKLKVSKETVDALETAEKTLTTLKAEEAKKAEEAAQAAASKTEATTTTKPSTTTASVKLPKLTLKVTAGKKKVKLTWKKTSKASGYIIYRATKKNGTYKKIKVVKGWKNNTYTNKKLKSKKTYYYKVCAYKGKVNGPVSAAKKAKAK